MCDPTYGGNARNGNNMTGALPNAPLSGHWFSAQFQQLLQTPTRHCEAGLEASVGYAVR